MIQAVIFDRDGVLIDSEFTNVAAAAHSFQQLGIPITEKEKTQVVGRHPDDYLPYFQEKYDVEYEEFRKLQREVYATILATTPLFPATVQLVRQLHRQRVRLGLCTSSSEESTKALLQRIGIADLFEVVVTKKDYVRRKPDPEPYLVTAKKLFIHPKDCLVIEDSRVGLESALNAGMTCVIITNRYTKDQDFTGALKVVESADQLDVDAILQTQSQRLSRLT
jgi:HAD superfamily hydrolase (TIGR01509 family)